MTVVRDTIQAGVIHRLSLSMESSPVESGKAGAFDLKEATLVVGATETDLVTAGWTTPDMVEVAYGVTGTASVTSAPVYAAAGGPSSENVYNIPVDDSSPFLAGEFLRAQSNGSTYVYEVLAVPDGTTIQVHAASADFAVINGNVVEQVTATGVYVGSLSLVVDTYFTVGQPTGELRIVMSTVASGDDPVFSTAEDLVWVFSLSLDIAGRPFRVG